MRWKVQRWHLPVPLGILSRRMPKRLAIIQKLTTPRVQAAAFRTLWNGWTTASRFQRCAACVLGCSPSAEDRIEHYAHCPFFSDLVKGWMGLRASLVSLGGFLLAADGMSDQELCLMSVAVYAMHRATAFYRSGFVPTAGQVKDFLQAMCQSAVRGHVASSRALDYAIRVRHASCSLR